MRLYDQTSAIDWFYGTEMTAEEMRGDQRYDQLFREPCVLYDDGAGRVYRYETLAALAARCAVPQSGPAEVVYERCVECLSGTYRAPGVSDAIEVAEEAKEIASQAGTDPQVQTIARLAMPSIDFASVTATDVVAIPDYIPEWSTLIGQKLKKNSPCRYNGTIYRASQDVTVQEIYPPDVAGESQYYPIEVAPDGIIVYRTCHGEYDMVRAGEKRHYPDAEGPVYRAKVDTAYDPDTVPGNWELVE